MVVQKFGGTSVADPDAVRRLIGIARAARALPAKIAETLYPLEISVEGGEVSGR